MGPLHRVFCVSSEGCCFEYFYCIGGFADKPIQQDGQTQECEVPEIYLEQFEIIALDRLEIIQFRLRLYRIVVCGVRLVSYAYVI